MNAEFNWWLLIVGLVVGAGLVWYVLMDARRREIDVETAERRREAAWLSATLAGDGWDVPVDAAERLLDLHRAYLEAPPPDVVHEDASGPGPVDAAPPTESTGVTSEGAAEDGVDRGA